MLHRWWNIVEGDLSDAGSRRLVSCDYHFLEAGAGHYLGAVGVADACGLVYAYLLAIVCIDDRQSRTASVLCTLATVFAGFFLFVGELLAGDESLPIDNPVSLGPFAFVECYSAFLVCDDYFDAGYGEGLVEFFHVLLPV